MEKCSNCAFYYELILWNKGGKDLPNYEEPSHCCILLSNEGRIHQRNDPDGLCECYVKK